MPQRALILAGGWPGHEPDGAARFARAELLGDWQVSVTSELSLLEPASLAAFDLLLPIWTFGELTPQQEAALCQAVEGGLGVVAWHGAASAFRASRRYQHLLGGQFVAHPGGDQQRYSVKFAAEPLSAELPDIELSTEQYYLLVDPAVQVLASTRIESHELPWLEGVEVPVAWQRAWGKGRVFYCALGHTVSVLRQPPVLELLRRAVAWAAR